MVADYVSMSIALNTHNLDLSGKEMQVKNVYKVKLSYFTIFLKYEASVFLRELSYLLIFIIYFMHFVLA